MNFGCVIKVKVASKKLKPFKINDCRKLKLLFPVCMEPGAATNIESHC